MVWKRSPFPVTAPNMKENKMAKKGDWVRIHRVVLPAEGRNPNLPADTAKVPLEMWV